MDTTELKFVLQIPVTEMLNWITTQVLRFFLIIIIWSVKYLTI